MQEKEKHKERQKNNNGIPSLVIQLLRQENVRKTERKRDAGKETTHRRQENLRKRPKENNKGNPSLV